MHAGLPGQNLPVRTLLSGGGSTTKEVFTRGKETNDEGNKVTCGYTVYTKANWFCGKEFKTQTGKQLRCVASTGSVWSSQGCPSCKRFEANLKPGLLKGLKDFTFKLPSKEEMEINAAKFPPKRLKSMQQNSLPLLRNWDTENENEKEVPVEVEAENPNPGWLGWEFGSPVRITFICGSWPKRQEKKRKEKKKKGTCVIHTVYRGSSFLFTKGGGAVLYCFLRLLTCQDMPTIEFFF